MASGSTRIRTTPAAMNGSVRLAAHRVHSRPRRCRRAESIGGRHGTDASSVRAALAKTPLPAGDRAAQDHQAGVLRELAHLRGGAVAVIPDGDITLLEL